MSAENISAVIGLAALFLGVLSRMLFPYLRKRREGSDEVEGGFRRGFIFVGLAGFIITMLLYSKFEDLPKVSDFASGTRFFATAFGTGFGWPSIVHEVAKWSGAFQDQA